MAKIFFFLALPRALLVSLRSAFFNIIFPLKMAEQSEASRQKKNILTRSYKNPPIWTLTLI